jgi:hypothetical protein
MPSLAPLVQLCEKNNIIAFACFTRKTKPLLRRMPDTGMRQWDARDGTMKQEKWAEPSCAAFAVLFLLLFRFFDFLQVENFVTGFILNKGTFAFSLLQAHFGYGFKCSLYALSLFAPFFPPCF